MTNKNETQAFIDAALERLPIADVFHQAGIPLKKSNNDYIAICPFHQEKTPSCHLYVQQNRYYCFGCGANGNALTFLMQQQGVSFHEALKYLSQKTGVPLPESKPSTKMVFGVKVQSRSHASKSITPKKTFREPKKQEPIIYDPEVIQDYQEINRKASMLYHQKVHEERAQDYLKKRHITDASVEKFLIGYADSESVVLKTLSLEIDEDRLINSGVVSKKSDKSVADKFRNRLMFPIRNTEGLVCGMGGRYIDTPIKGSSFGKTTPPVRPKYINTAETPAYHKSQMLYGLYENKSIIQKTKKAFVVEGYLDVIGLCQAGIENAVASCGTALTEAQISELLNYAQDLILCFDGDEAGQKASIRAAERLLPFLVDRVNIRFMKMPEGLDPFDLSLQTDGVDVFDRLALNARSLLDVFLDALIEKQTVHNKEDAEKFAAESSYFGEQIKGEAHRHAWFSMAQSVIQEWLPQAFPSIGSTAAKKESDPIDENCSVSVLNDLNASLYGLDYKKEIIPLSESLIERAVWILFTQEWEAYKDLWEEISVPLLVYDAKISPATRQLYQTLQSVYKHSLQDGPVNMDHYTTMGVHQSLKSVRKQVAFLEAFESMTGFEKRAELKGIIKKITNHANQSRNLFLAVEEYIL